MELKFHCNSCHKEITNLEELFMVTRDKKIFLHRKCANKLGLNKSEEIDFDSLEKGFERKQQDKINSDIQNKYITIEIENEMENIIITTTNNIDGFRVIKYIDIESVEIVLGTGIFSEITAGIGDVFGLRSNAYESKLSDAKKTAMNLLKKRANSKGGNAIIGIDIGYTEFANDRIGLIINGTIVKIEPII